MELCRIRSVWDTKGGAVNRMKKWYDAGRDCGKGGIGKANPTSSYGKGSNVFGKK
jgi:hypothetical protein